MKKIFFMCMFICAHLFGALEQVCLPVPNLSKDAITNYSVGLRPVRVSGIRVEPEFRDNTWIVHHYGHGGSGISLAWGSAQEVLAYLHHIERIEHLDKTQSIAIVGAGVVGLSTAHLLKDHGYNVRIYAKDVPPYTTSDVALGIWGPYAVHEGATTAQKEFFERITHHSFEIMKEWGVHEAPRFKGITLKEVYKFGDLEGRLAKSPWYVFGDNEMVEVCFDNGVCKKARRSYFLTVDVPLYMRDLYHQAQQRGIEIISREFMSAEQMCTLEERIVINCTGLASRFLFNDKALIPVRGQQIHFKSGNPDFPMLAVYGDGGFSIVPRFGDTVLWGTYEKGIEQCEVDSAICDALLSNAQKFFNQ